MADKKLNIGVSDIVLAVVSVFFVAGFSAFLEHVVQRLTEAG